jgi:hypothetical protein
MVSCPACSGQAADESRYCPTCGNALGPGSIDPTRTSYPRAERSGSTPFDEGRFLPGTVVAGRYRLGSRIGELDRGQKVDLAVHAAKDGWRGRNSVELVVRDLRPR